MFVPDMMYFRQSGDMNNKTSKIDIGVQADGQISKAANCYLLPLPQTERGGACLHKLSIKPQTAASPQHGCSLNLQAVFIKS